MKAGHGFGLRTAPPRGNHNKNNGGSSSDMDIASDSDEDDTHERHHSPLPSPQDYKTHVRFPHLAAQAHNGGGLGRNGAKAFGFGGDDLSDSATSNQVSYVHSCYPLHTFEKPLFTPVFFNTKFLELII